jgi:hypothetical protein
MNCSTCITLGGRGEVYTYPTSTSPMMHLHNAIMTLDGGVLVKCSSVPKRRSLVS